MAVDQLKKTEAPLSFGAFKAKKECDTSARTGRLQLVLPERSIQRLEAIKEATEATTYAEVLRHSLRIYEALLAERERGGDLVIRRSNGEEVAIPLHLFVR